MAEIALGVGFRTQSHFTMHFRRLTGLTPTAYRQAYGIQSIEGSLQSALEREPRGKPGSRLDSTARMVS